MQRGADVLTKSRITRAREDAGLSLKDFADILDVNITTVSNWENGRRQPTLERLIDIAGSLSVSVSYLLGSDEKPLYTEPVGKEMLPVLHWTPVWIPGIGWALVNFTEKTFVLADKSSISFDEVQGQIYIIPPALSIGLSGVGAPLDIDDICERNRVWVEPISHDQDLANELRGWYHPHSNRFVENEYGNRFYLDTYGAKWLAFESWRWYGDEDAMNPV